MDTALVLFVFSVINGLIAVANFLSGKRKSGEQDGILLANIETIKIMISELKSDLKELKNRNYIFDERLTKVEVQCDNVRDRVEVLEDLLLHNNKEAE